MESVIIEFFPKKVPMNLLGAHPLWTRIVPVLHHIEVFASMVTFSIAIFQNSSEWNYNITYVSLRIASVTVVATNNNNRLATIAKSPLESVSQVV